MRACRLRASIGPFSARWRSISRCGSHWGRIYFRCAMPNRSRGSRYSKFRRSPSTRTAPSGGGRRRLHPNPQRIRRWRRRSRPLSPCRRAGPSKTSDFWAPRTPPYGSIDRSIAANGYRGYFSGIKKLSRVTCSARQCMTSSKTFSPRFTTNTPSCTQAGRTGSVTACAPAGSSLTASPKTTRRCISTKHCLWLTTPSIVLHISVGPISRKIRKPVRH